MEKNKEKVWDLSKVKIADLRFFDKEHNGIELSEPLSKGILIGPLEDGRYYNPFCLDDNYPIFGRDFISNVSLNGESYGTKVYHVSNELATGPCWVLTNIDLKDEIDNACVSFSDIEAYVINSSYYFKDRAPLIKGRTKGRKGRKLLRQYLSDMENEKVMDEFFAVRECGVQKIKKD